MPPRHLEHIEYAKAEAARLGAIMLIERAKKHYVGIIHMNGKQRKVFFSTTPRDKKVNHVVAEDVRRKIKEMV